MKRRRDEPPPARWEDFEDLCLELWRPVLPNAKKNGRSGQPQAGVDIYGRHPETGEWWGIQCKTKRGWPKNCLRTEEVAVEVGKAEGFQPQLSHFVVTTTTPRDATAQEAVRELSDQRLEMGGFSVELESWDDVLDRLYEKSEADELELAPPRETQNHAVPKLDIGPQGELVTTPDEMEVIAEEIILNLEDKVFPALRINIHCDLLRWRKWSILDLGPMSEWQIFEELGETAQGSMELEDLHSSLMNKARPSIDDRKALLVLRKVLPKILRYEEEVARCVSLIASKTGARKSSFLYSVRSTAQCIEGFLDFVFGDPGEIPGDFRKIYVYRPDRSVHETSIYLSPDEVADFKRMRKVGDATDIPDRVIVRKVIPLIIYSLFFGSEQGLEDFTENLFIFTEWDYRLEYRLLFEV